MRQAWTFARNKLSLNSRVIALRRGRLRKRSEMITSRVEFPFLLFRARLVIRAKLALRLIFLTTAKGSLLSFANRDREKLK